MYAAEVVVGEEQGEGGFVVFPFLGMGIRQPSQSPDGHSHGKIGPLNMRRANFVHVGLAEL